MASASNRLRILRDLLEHSLRGPLSQRIAFLHVPKCGGVSVRAAVRRAYGLQGRSKGVVQTIDPSTSSRLAAAAGVPTALMRKYLVANAMLGSARHIGGHVQYDAALDAAVGREWSYVTVLRDPVRKWYSQYFYNRFKDAEHGKVTEDLEAFLESPAARMYGHDYAFYLGPGRPETGEPLDVAATIANLDRFEVIGLLEELPRFVHDFERAFGPRLRILHQNRTPAPASARKLAEDPDLRAKVEALCSVNLEVYEAVRQRAARAA